MRDCRWLEAKLKVEREDPKGKFLLYAPTEEPSFDNDWLLDIRLYSRSFRADRASLLQAELGLVNQQLRQHIADRRKFFDNKDRLRKLTEMVLPTDTADDLDRKMLTVVLKADQAEFFTLVRTVFHAYLTDDAGDPPDLAQPPAVWEQAEKFDLDQFFWASAKTAFGYDDAQPTLKNFLIRLMVTDFAQGIRRLLRPAGLGERVPTGREGACELLRRLTDGGMSFGTLNPDAIFRRLSRHKG